MGVRGQIVSRGAIDRSVISEMYLLHGEVFHDHPRSIFEADLAGKDQVVLMWAGDRLVGFSTILSYPAELDGETVGVFFSGDTVVHPEYLGSPVLQRCWLKAAMAVHDATPERRLFWLLLCGGYGTYRYLPLFFQEFWPQHTGPTPEPAQQLMDLLAVRRYGDRYRDGVVALGGGGLRVSASREHRRSAQTPHAVFFRAQNPGYRSGDELVCLTEITPANFSRAGRKLLQVIGG